MISCIYDKNTTLKRLFSYNQDEVKVLENTPFLLIKNATYVDSEGKEYFTLNINCTKPINLNKLRLDNDTNNIKPPFSLEKVKLLLSFSYEEIKEDKLFKDFENYVLMRIQK